MCLKYDVRRSYPVDVTDYSHPFSLPPANVSQSFVLCGRRDCAGSGRNSCSHRSGGSRGRHSCEGLSSRWLHPRSFPVLVGVYVIVDGRIEVLQQYGNQHDELSEEICNTCLEILSEYTDWIDISFMINPVTLQTLFTLVESPSYVEKTLLTFEELIGKGMPAENKISLIHSLTINILWPLIL